MRVATSISSPRTREFREQIVAGRTEEEIRATWQPVSLSSAKMGKKYLLYK